MLPSVLRLLIAYCLGGTSHTGAPGARPHSLIAQLCQATFQEGEDDGGGRAAFAALAEALQVRVPHPLPCAGSLLF